jgi:hypothetical protein
VLSAAAAAADQADGETRQTVVVNLTLSDDAALGEVVGALAGLGSHIVALRKSEPSLEDVFVELVGRGFDEAETEPHTGEARRETTPDPDEPTHESGEREEEEVGV